MISDAELLSQYRAARSNEVFARIVERHGSLVLRTCLRRLDNLHDAEDAAQDAFEALAQQSDSIRGSLGAWLHGVAQHAANHLLRSRVRRVRREEAAASMRAMPQPALCEQTEWRDELDAALAQLPEPLREAVILRYLEGRKFDEAARLAGCPLATLSRRAAEGINRLRSILARRGMVFSAAVLAGLLAQEAVPSAAFAQAVVGPTLCAHPGTGQTAASMVAHLHKDGVIVWCSLVTPCISVFLPFFVDGSVPGALAQGAATFTPESPWWRIKRLLNRAAENWGESFPRLRAHWQEWQQALLREAADFRKESSDHKTMWVNRNVAKLLTEIAALERAFGLER